MARMLVVRKRVEHREEESRDVYELASEAADCLETYRRAPWTQINDRIRMTNLARAIELLQRAHDIETGKIAPPIWGDV
jgi:hypothetical protein